MAETRRYSMRSKSEDLTQEKDNAIAEWISFIAAPGRKEARKACFMAHKNCQGINLFNEMGIGVRGPRESYPRLESFSCQFCFTLRHSPPQANKWRNRTRLTGAP